jgi:hypothetical protein
MKKKKDDPRDETTKRLDAIIRLLLDAQIANANTKKITKKDQILGLYSVGLTDTEIGRIIGQARNEVSSIRTHAKRPKKK